MPSVADSRAMLGVDLGASEDEINKAFLRKAKSVHPDINDAEDAHEQFIRLNQAKERLLEHLAAPPPGADVPLYRPANPVVDDEEKEAIIRASRRKRERDERRRSQGRARRKREAQQAERKTKAFLEEIERRRVEQERQAEERLRREREEREQQQQEERRRAAQARAEQAERERRAAQEREEQERLQLERQAREARERAEQERLQREARERAERERLVREQAELERVAAERSATEAPLYCAWRDCQRADQLSQPVSTPLGWRRFCRRHHHEFQQWNQTSRQKAGSRGRRAQRQA